MNCLRPIILCGVLALSACGEAPPLTGQAQADAATRAACERRAEAVYAQQNRGDIYSPPAQVNTPFSSNFSPGTSNRGLSQVFARNQMVRDCVRNRGTQPISPSAPTPAPPPAPH